MILKTASKVSGKSTFDYFSKTGKTGSKALRRLRRKGRPSYEVTKFPASKDVLEVIVSKTDNLAKAFAALLD